MQKLLLLGDEAIAQAAIDAGISGIYAYPGTPSTEIMEYIQASKQAKENDIHRQWSANEKTAIEAAIGMSYAGKRAIVCMKHGIERSCRWFHECSYHRCQWRTCCCFSR
jgi:indolepyruvate ferredoxin oxidoreductase alpha subunit